MVVDAECKILSVNAAFGEITGYQEDEVLGKDPKLLQSGRHKKAFYKEMWQIIHTAGHWEGEIWNRKKSGALYPEWLSITAVRDEDDNVVQYTGLFSDMSRRKAALLFLRPRLLKNGLPGGPTVGNTLIRGFSFQTALFPWLKQS